MNLWLIEQSSNNGYDTYDSAVVVAATEHDARHIHPSAMYDGKPWWLDKSPFGATSNWALPERVKATRVGEAMVDAVAGSVVVASFNAG